MDTVLADEKFSYLGPRWYPRAREAKAERVQGHRGGPFVLLSKSVNIFDTFEKR